MKKAWWKETAVYQIYPRSFHDSNGDGVGDLRGIIEKIDYLQQLGIGVVWLSPVYKSPNDDNGYDISDYQDIMDEFGTLDDLDELIAGLHQRGIKLVMDLVVNHTSDEHVWFQESRKSKDNPYRDFYVWRPPKDGREPNNWASHFSPSAWEFDETTDEYFLHLWSKKQPDLNWENPAVRQAIYKMMHWWLKRGVDGFRMDVINMISKVPSMPDVPADNGQHYHYAGQFFTNGPRFMEFMHEMKREVLSLYDIVTIGETPLVTPKQGLEYTHANTGVVSMVFQFEHVDLDIEFDPVTGSKLPKPLQLTELKQIMSRWQNALADGGWNSLYFNNHDQARSVSRFGDDAMYRVESAKVLATLIHLQQGTPFIYQGEEIGMTNVAFEQLDDYRDIEMFHRYDLLINERGLPPEEALSMLRPRSRDNARTPMQWDDSHAAGFSSGEPWIKVNPNYVSINVEAALADSDSVFYYYQQLIRLRQTHPIVVYGRYDLILEDDKAIYAFTRTLDDERLLVILNFTADSAEFNLPSNITFEHADLLISNYPARAEKSSVQLQQTLRPYEAIVYHLQG